MLSNLMNSSFFKSSDHDGSPNPLNHGNHIRIIKLESLAIMYSFICLAKLY